MIVNVTGSHAISGKEIEVYIKRGNDLYGEHLKAIDIEVISEEEVKIVYHIFTKAPFERIRRITGYLVGNMNKWNDAKRAEEHDRVKHDVEF